VDLDAAGRIPVEVGPPVPFHSVEKVTVETGAESDTAAAAERRTDAD
jgi:hypothetical protein